MTWASTDREKIRRHLSIPSTMQALEELDFLMGSAKADQITTSQTAISKLDSLQTDFETMGAKDIGITRADVVEFGGPPENRFAGIRAQQAYWREQLSLALAYDGRFSFTATAGANQAALMRS